MTCCTIYMVLVIWLCHTESQNIVNESNSMNAIGWFHSRYEIYTNSQTSNYLLCNYDNFFVLADYS